MVVLERDERFHPFSAVVEDLEKAREIFYKHRPATAPAVPAQPARTCAIDENAAARLDPNDARYAGLLSYQQALMRELTDEDFNRRLAADPELVAREFGLSGVWRERFDSRVPKAISRLAMIYRSIRRFEDQAEADYQRQQWAAWGQMA